MDRDKYLKRINYLDNVVVNNETLMQLHEHHVLNVPFENLDVHYKKFFDLELANLYKKIVVNFRGGFCYELNALFNELLKSIGFKSKLIEARIFDNLDNVGPKYDHMCIYVETDKKYLVDVGFGDLFITPLEIRVGIQIDSRNSFKIEICNEYDFMLSMSEDGTVFYKKYIFILKEVQINEFYEMCSDKQTNPLSYFVKNTVCTKPTSSGRLTLFNNKLIETHNKERFEQLIHNDIELRTLLKTLFGITIQP